MANPEINLLVLMVFIVVTVSLWLPKPFRHHLIMNIVIPLALLISWIGLILFQSYKIESVFSILTDEYSSKYLTNFNTDELIQGEKISGKFYADEKYLGIVGVRFWNFWRLNDDNIIFRIKESGSDQWYYENRHKSDQFQPHQYFTFGFPTIENSQGKYYEFEVESEHGEPGNAVGVSEISPTFITKYKFPREVILSSPRNAISFVLTKFGNLTRNSSFNASSYVFLLPFLLYVLSSKYLFRNRERLNSALSKFIGFIEVNRKLIAIGSLVLGVILDGLLIRIGDMTMILLFLLWIYSFKCFNLSLKLIFNLSLVMLLVSGLVYYLKMDIATERFGAWAWGFLTLTVIMTIYKQKFVPQT
jgi:hypothetical protein